eukprot:Nitzschia sp. Nitz4//scaffold15_size197535//78838//80549//NITZ4_001577-RA/size197535-processed-gene-0.247-mRNA-1//1//CDS//3329537712//8759//frame0
MWYSSLFFKSLLLAGAISPCLVSSIDSSNVDLTGYHFKVTGLVQAGFLEVDAAGDEWSGYLFEMLDAVSKKANFTYELRPPSGLGSRCEHSDGEVDPFTTYGAEYRVQYQCGQSDVNDLNLRDTVFGSDMYLGLFYITPGRLSQNLFSTAFHPPATGAMTMYGTATGISSIEDLIEQQQQGLQKPICILRNTATTDFIQQSYPLLEVRDFVPTSSYDEYQSFADGDCEIHIADYPIATQFILDHYNEGNCMARGKYAIGIRNDMPQEVVHAIDYWMTDLMTCVPEDPDCESFSELYGNLGGTGDECGYGALDTEDKSLSKGGLLAVVLSVLLAFLVCLLTGVRWMLDQVRLRYRQRFINQIASHISLNSSTIAVSSGKLLEEVENLVQSHTIISKRDLQMWMLENQFEFLSRRDFSALWHAIDIDDTELIDPLEFIVIMSACGPDFEQDYKNLERRTAAERLHWASIRLSNICQIENGGSPAAGARSRPMEESDDSTSQLSESRRSSSLSHIPPPTTTVSVRPTQVEIDDTNEV